MCAMMPMFRSSGSGVVLGIYLISSGFASFIQGPKAMKKGAWM
jgi:hypothetical protein